MSKKKEEIVDLIPSEDGVYSTESRHCPVPIKDEKPKKANKNLEEFFDGMDIGLEFVEGMSKRVSRMLKLRD